MVYKLYSSNISYFSGKMECYLRYKGVPLEIIELDATIFRGEVLKNTGLAKMPSIKCADGTWLTDTSPMIDWFEDKHAESSIMPDDRAMGFVARLLEDYGDEWLWRPALHYRWSYAKDAELLGTRIATELLHPLKLPQFLRKRFIQKRQRRVYVAGDGVTAKTWDHVEGTYLRTLDAMQEIFEKRPFLLGERPSLADFGLFGPMFRHFGLDPTPQRIMLERAPAVFEWVARMWNAQADKMDGDFLDAPDEPLLRLLCDFGSMYAPYLKKNAAAWATGAKTFNAFIEGNLYEDLPVAQYRVYCLEQLQKHLSELESSARDQLEEWLKPYNILAVLDEPVEQASYYDPEELLPVCSTPLSEADMKAVGKRGTVWGRS